jgi:branched-chain amino acid transport system substrate-binding protein
MESIKGWDSGGIIPPVSFSDSQHHAQFAGRICEVRSGRFVPISDWVVE